MNQIHRTTICKNAVDEYYSTVDQQHHTSNHVTVWRWREAYQNDFAARMDWGTKNYETANHPPIPALTHDENLKVTAGDEITLDATGSTDPDGNTLHYEWFHYREPGTFKGQLEIDNAKEKIVKIPAPAVDYPQTTHFILKLTDSGTPALTRYKRVIVSILPKE